MTSNYDIVIVGGGLIGSTMALWLAKHTDLSLALFERNDLIESVAEPNQRVVALGNVAVGLLAELNVFNRLTESQAFPYQRMRVWDEGSDGELNFDAGQLDLSHLGFMVDSVACTRELQLAIHSSDRIDDFFNCGIEGFKLNDQVTIATTNDNYTAQLLIGADGGNSQVRRAAKIFANKRSYDQRGIVARIHCSEPHQSCAWQRFLKTGPIALLPLANNECSIVWSAESALAKELMSLDDDDFARRLEQAVEGRLGDIDVRSQRQSFPLTSQRAQHYYRGHTVLLGDAAHTIHPLAGQGANLGFKDIACLGKLLQAVDRSSIASASVLANYQRIRQRDNQQTDALMSALDAAYRIETPLWLALRGAGMNWINRRQTIISLLAHQAMGLGNGSVRHG